HDLHEAEVPRAADVPGLLGIARQDDDGRAAGRVDHEGGAHLRFRISACDVERARGEADAAADVARRTVASGAAFRSAGHGLAIEAAQVARQEVADRVVLTGAAV